MSDQERNDEAGQPVRSSAWLGRWLEYLRLKAMLQAANLRIGILQCQLQFAYFRIGIRELFGNGES